MKKKWWIILICVIVLLLIWAGIILIKRIRPVEDHEIDTLYERWKSNPYFDKSAICVWIDGWECPQRFLEENDIEFTIYGVIKELPKWWEEAGCVEKTVKIPCSKYLN